MATADGLAMTAAILDELIARRYVPGRPADLADDMAWVRAAWCPAARSLAAFSGVDVRVPGGQGHQPGRRLGYHHGGLHGQVPADVDQLAVTEHPPAEFAIELL